MFEYFREPKLCKYSTSSESLTKAGAYGRTPRSRGSFQFFRFSSFIADVPWVRKIQRQVDKLGFLLWEKERRSSENSRETERERESCTPTKLYLIYKSKLCLERNFSRITRIRFVSNSFLASTLLEFCLIARDLLHILAAAAHFTRCFAKLQKIEIFPSEIFIFDIKIFYPRGRISTRAVDISIK